VIKAWDDTERPVLRMDMDGGRACLDLLNTLSPAVPNSLQTIPADTQDLLQTYQDLIALAVRTVLLPVEEADILFDLAEKNPASAETFLVSTKNFRSLLLRLIIKPIQKIPPLPRDLASFEELRARARSFEVIVWEDGQYRLHSRYQAEGMAAPLNGFIRDADALLRSPDLQQIKIARSGSQESRVVFG
jgi:hypothetical protein